MGAAGTAQSSATTLGITTDSDKPSLGGRFASAYPLYDGTNRMLVSWAPCLVLDTTVTPTATKVCDNDNTSGPNVQLAPPQYTIWIYDLDKGTLSPILGAQTNTVIVEPVIMQARTNPPTPPERLRTHRRRRPAGQQHQRRTGSAGHPQRLRLRRGGQGFRRDRRRGGEHRRPGRPQAGHRRHAAARFVRIEKAVEIPDKTVRKINNSAFGPAGLGMREILAYAPVEPDGSVRIELPANVPFTIDVLDKNARSIGARHTSWLQLMPGETKTCNGCHIAGSMTTPSHGRSGLTPSVNPGASGAGVPFPNTVGALSATNPRDTMADARAGNTCHTGAPTGVVCSQIPSIDVIYSDVWTDPVTAGRPADTGFQYLYNDLSTPKPYNAHCLPNWDPLCRSTIHYPDATATGGTTSYHIQTIWNFPRQTLATDGSGTVVSDHTCVLCHTPVDLVNAVQQVPAGQLDLTDSGSNVDTTVTTSYEQLLFAHNEQTLTMGVLQDLLVPTPGPPDPVTGLPTTVLVPVSLAPPLTAGSANGSAAKFFAKFDGTDHGTTVDHTGYLTKAELRLIAEWIDIGAQYYNDPFVAPVAN